MFDRAQRNRGRASDSPPPGAYSPTLPTMPIRPSMAPFATGAPRLGGGGRSPRAAHDPPPMQYLGHEGIKLKGAAKAPTPFLTTADRFTESHKPKLQIKMKDGKVLVAPPKVKDVPGPGAYDNPVASIRKDSGFTFGGAARPTTAPASTHVDEQGNLLAWTNVRKNPPSIPSTLDYGYDFGADGTLLPQKPPAEKIPKGWTPGPTAYTPKDTLESSHTRRSSFVTFSASRARRVDFSQLGEKKNPGPGEYEAVADHVLPSAKLPSSVFASKTRKGIDAVIGRMPTSSKVGPGSHFDDKATTTFRPATASKAQRFGITSSRFQHIDGDAVPGPGAYDTPSSAAAVALAAKKQEHLLMHIAARRSIQDQLRHRSKSPPEYAAGEVPSESPRSARSGNQSVSPVRDVPPVPVFFTSASRFAPTAAERGNLPAVGQYDLRKSESTSSVRSRATSAPHGSRQGMFNTTAPRFARDSLGRPSTTGASIGPGSYIPDVVPSERSSAQRSRPSSSFLAPADRSLPGPDKSIGDTDLLTQDLRKPIGSQGISVSAQLGKYSALAPERLADRPKEGPGPGAYNVTRPVIDVLALKKKYASTLRPTISSMSSGTAPYMITSGPRFQDPREKIPGPGQYDPDLAFGGRTKRTFNVNLAANEARAIITKNMTTVGVLVT